MNTKYRAKAKKYDFEKNEYKFLNNSKLDIVKNKVLYGSLVMKKWKNRLELLYQWTVTELNIYQNFYKNLVDQFSIRKILFL